MFLSVIAEVQPTFIIEVGTWLGASAIHMANLCRDLGLDASILCVDTWLGAVEFWLDTQDDTRYGALELLHGYPQVYYQFLGNVMLAGHKDRIIPFPTTSLIAARWLKRKKMTADLIYIDASHDYPDVLADIEAYWEILRSGGILFGDDFHVFTDVNRAVEDFCKKNRLQFMTDDRKWSIKKP